MGGRTTTGVIAGLGALSAAAAGFLAAGTGPRLPDRPMVVPAASTATPTESAASKVEVSRRVGDPALSEDAQITDAEEAQIADDEEVVGGTYGPTDPPT